MVEEFVARFDVFRQTGGSLVVAFVLFACLVHDVVEGNATHQTSYGVDHRHYRQVVFFEGDDHFVERLVGFNAVGLGLHYMLDFRHRRVGDKRL